MRVSISSVGKRMVGYFLMTLYFTCKRVDLGHHADISVLVGVIGDRDPGETLSGFALRTE